MPSPPSRRLSATPYFPGAWPTASRDIHDDSQDADVSSVSSYGGISTEVRARQDSNCKARRRWTYAGTTRSQALDSSPDSPTSSPHNTRAMHEATMSPLTEHTGSAASSQLNTPDLADWPTQLCGSQSLLLDHFGLPSNSPSSSTRYHKTSLPRMHGAHARHPQLFTTTSRNYPCPSTHLDPPLLSFISGLPPLKLPLSELSIDFPSQGSPSGHSLSPLDVSSPVTNGESPEITLSYASSATDSPVLPPAVITHSAGEEPINSSQSLTPPHDMDAFALATAVAASNSRSSFSIPPSMHSAMPAMSADAIPIDTPLLSVRRQPSGTTEASSGHRGQDTHPGTFRLDCDASVHGGLSTEHNDLNRTRRLSAPAPIAWQPSRVQPVRTISSRVHVGDGGVSGRRASNARKPVLDKVRKFGVRIRGMFKGRGDTVTKGNGDVTNPEYGMMTTTTAVTNVEYESEHPIPLPSPRAKIMRNHRRSLPLPMFLSSLERAQPLAFGPTSSTHHDVVAEPPSTRLPEDKASAAKEPDHNPSSPQTPRPRRERTQTAPQAPEEKSANEKKARRFSLSSALSKSRKASFRTTVVPPPPLPTSTFQPRSDDYVIVGPDGPATSAAAEVQPDLQSMPSRERIWGRELPNVHYQAETAGMKERPSARSRTRTAPSQPLVPSYAEAFTSTPKDKRSRRFSLSSMMARRSTRSLVPLGGHALDDVASTSTKKVMRISRRRPRGDTKTTITHESVQFDLVTPPFERDLSPLPTISTTAQRSSFVSSVASSGGETVYFDALEPTGQDENFLTSGRFSPRPESDLDSMSFARTADYSSATFSFGSGTEREYYLDASEPSTSGSYNRHIRDTAARLEGTSTMSQLVGDCPNTPITKTLRFSPSLSLSFDMSGSDYGDDDDVGRLEHEEELSFMRALGFEFDEIARRAREE